MSRRVTIAVAILGVILLLIGSRVRFVTALPEAPMPAAPRPDTPLVIGGHGLAIPVPGVPARALTDTFAEARGEGRVHDAIDIMAARGTPVIAAAAGRVEKVFESLRGGHTVYVRSPDGRWVYYYAHLDRYAEGLREGAAVVRGQLLGAVGFTGDASVDGPHLHFEIKAMAPGERWYQGRAIDPYPLLASSGR